MGSSQNHLLSLCLKFFPFYRNGGQYWKSTIARSLKCRPSGWWTGWGEFTSIPRSTGAEDLLWFASLFQFCTSLENCVNWYPQFFYFQHFLLVATLYAFYKSRVNPFSKKNATWQNYIDNPDPYTFSCGMGLISVMYRKSTEGLQLKNWTAYVANTRHHCRGRSSSPNHLGGSYP